MEPAKRRRGGVCCEFEFLPLSKRTKEERQAARESLKLIFGQPNNLGVECAACGEPKGQVGVHDSEGHQVHLCMRCNWMMDWH